MRLAAKNMSIGYGNKAVFDNIGFNAAAGDFIALLGINGIGKSTLLKTLGGVINPRGGELLLSSKPYSSYNVSERAKQISLVLTEKLWIDNIAVRDFVAMGRAPYTGAMGTLSERDKKLVQDTLDLSSTAKLADKYFNEISDGEKQKVLLVRALCQATPVIILDEPTAFLDFRNKEDILNILKQAAVTEQKTIILSTHDIDNSLEYCNKCWVMTEEKTFREVQIQGEDSKKLVKQLLKVGA